MPALGVVPPPQADEDTLTELDRVPAIDTMVVPPEASARDGHERPTAPRASSPRRSARPKPHFGVQAARIIIALAVIAGLLLLVIWLFGQSQ